MREDEKMLLIFGNVPELRDKPFDLDMISWIKLIFYGSLHKITIEFHLYERYMREFDFDESTTLSVDKVSFDVAIDILRAFKRYTDVSDVDRLWWSGNEIMQAAEEGLCRKTSGC
jgi:hypothetical protein